MTPPPAGRLIAGVAVATLAVVTVAGCSPSLAPDPDIAGSDASTARTLPSGGSASEAAGSTGTAAAVEPTGELTVFAAASLRAVVEELAQGMEERHPSLEVTVSFAGSSDLVSQVLAGAPADVLVTADGVTMQRATDEGAVGEPLTIATNSPALVVPAGNPADVTGMDDLAGTDLVLCAPHVPCGAAAAALAASAGTTLEPVSEESSVADVLAKVVSGQADVGIVFTTDVIRAGGSVEAIPVPGSEDIVNHYRAAAVLDGDAGLADLWLAELTGENGRAALVDAGFGLP